MIALTGFDKVQPGFGIQGFGMGCYKLGAIACLLVAVSTSGVLAQDAQHCSCLLPTVEGGVAVGELSAVSGDVMMSQPAGYSAASQGSSIVVGARIIVGPNSSASLLFGKNCPMTVSAGSTVKVDLSQAGVCVSVSQTAVEQTAVQEGAVAGSPNRGLLGAALGAAAVAGGVALIVSSDDGDGVSD